MSLTAGASTVFQNATSGIYKDLWMNLQKAGESKSLISTVEEGVHRVLTSDYAFVHPTLALKQEMAAKGWSRFHLAPDGFWPSSYAIVLPKGSPYKPAFDRK
jgi:hypothetical protein